jgi:hypothetical protein
MRRLINFRRRRSLARRARMRHPRAVAAGLVRAFDGNAILIEPQRDCTAPPRIDPVDDRHH